VNTPPYQQAFERVRAEFLEMPGMRLRPDQVERLCGVERVVCARVLDDLVRAGFLSSSANGSYGRSTDASTERPRHNETTAEAVPAR
jgi:hypothetical protein